MKSKMLTAVGTALLLTSCLLSQLAGATTLKNLRVSHTADSTRVVIDLDSPPQQIWFLSGNSLLIDFANSHSIADFSQINLDKTAIDSISTRVLKKGKLRIEIKLKATVEPKVFGLKKNKSTDDRLVIDLKHLSAVDKTETAKSSSSKASATTGNVADFKVNASQSSSAPNIELAIKRNYLIAVDPGHGGEDSGALGPNNEQEKNVTLAISKELVEQINAQPGYNAKLLRTSDYYLSLQKRRDLAREYKADLLISIHADSFKDPDAYGASVFALSRKGATSEMARFLAQRENDSDLIGRVGGTTLDDKDAVLQGVLVDLSMNATVNSSLELGKLVLNQLSKFAPLHSNHVEQAGFLVLKSPDVPSILVETGFISNKRETKKLASPEYQTQIAQAVLKGIQLYFEQHPPTTVTRADSKADAKTDIKSEK